MGLTVATLLLTLGAGPSGCGSPGSSGTGGKSGGSGGTSGGSGGTSGGSGGTSAGSGGATQSGGTSGTAGAGTGGAATGGAPAGTGGTAGAAAGGRAATGGTGPTGGTSGRGGAGTGGAAGGAAGGAIGSSGGAGGTVAGCATFGTPTQVGTIAGATISAGPSGMVASRAHPGVVYAHLDTGGPATIFAMTIAGAALGEYALTGITQNDWEDMTVGIGPGAGTYIYMADIGDNNAVRTEVQVYRVAEPNVSTTQAPVQMAVASQVLRFTYPGGTAHNAETLILDPVSGDILIITKEAAGTTALYRAPGNTPADTPTVLERVVAVQAANASAGDISPNGDRFIVRTLSAVLLWPRAATLAATFMVAPRSQAFAGPNQSEGITFTADGRSWLTTAENSNAIYRADQTCP